MQTVSLTSFPAASVSVSVLPVRWPSSLSSSCVTSLFLRWTFHSEPDYNLLKDLQNKLGLTYMFIAHDLNIVKYISDRIAVMYLGNLVELADSDEIYDYTLHPYSKALLSSVPIPDPDKEAQKKAQVLSGDVPSPINPKPAAPLPTAAPTPPTGAVKRLRCSRKHVRAILWPVIWCNTGEVLPYHSLRQVRGLFYFA